MTAQAPETSSSAEASWRNHRIRLLLAKADENPSWVLTERRCAKFKFCAAFLELCDDKCLRVGRGAMKHARVAVDLAAKVHDPHLIHRSRGVLAHAYIARCDWVGAAEVLEGYRLEAFACCESCAGDWLRRNGDLLVETFDVEGARKALDQAAEKLDVEHDVDMDGRLRFLRGIAFHKSRDGEKALLEAGEALLKLDLTAPRGYFMDGLAFIGCFLQFRPDHRLYDLALSYLHRFRERIKGLRGWTEVRLRLIWVEALVFARLGDHKKGVERLERVLAGIFDSAPPKHVLAVTIDLCQLFSHRASDVDLRAIRRLIQRCYRLDIDKGQRWWLKRVKHVASQRPEKTFSILMAFRFAFKAPVPGLLSEVRLRKEDDLFSLEGRRSRRAS